MAFADTSRVTTLPAPTMAFSPMTTFDRIVAPDPIDAPLLTNVVATFQSFGRYSPTNSGSANRETVVFQ